MIDLFETENQIHFTVMKILVLASAQPTMISSHSRTYFAGIQYVIVMYQKLFDYKIH